MCPASSGKGLKMCPNAWRRAAPLAFEPQEHGQEELQEAGPPSREGTHKRSPAEVSFSARG